MPLDTTKFINPDQVGGITRYTLDDGEGRGVRVCEVDTGGGLRYRVLVDRGLDIDRAFMNDQSLAFLTHRGVSQPTRALDRGADWLRGFPGGLLVSCGPFNTGAPATDEGEELGLHGPHSNTAAELESVVCPQPHLGENEMRIRGRIRYGAFYGPNLTLERTIRSTLGEPTISIDDVFQNPGNQPVPHAWLLHINFGYPLLDEGTEFLIDHTGQRPRDDKLSTTYFTNNDGNTFPPPSPLQMGDKHVFRYLHPRPAADGMIHAAIWNPKISLGAVIDYSPSEFARLGQWMHWGEREYVCALEPMTGGVEGRDKDRQRGWLRMIAPGEIVEYHYRIRAVTSRPQENQPAQS
jgi:Domain of unknown function (DUF4432)